MAEEAKSRGNKAFSAGDYASAVEHFTDAIALSPTNHVLYSNRSAAHASLHHYADALKDAKKTVELNPDWSKGYSRLGAAHLGLHQIQDAISAYKKGLEIDPNNEGLKSGLADAQAAASRSRAAPPPSPFGNVFSGPEMWAKLTADPSTRIYLQQPDFVKMMQDIQKNPNNLNLYLKDQRVMQAIGVLLNVKLGGPNSGDDMEIPEETFTPQSSASERKEDKKMEEEKVAEPEPMEVTGEEKEAKEAKERKAQAAKEKELGNAAYKKKEFEKAIEHYTKATELDDEDISYLTNRAAVYLETGKYDECIKDCDKAVERGRELRSDFKMIARALTRKGTALVKMAACSRDYEPAIETFQKALTEHRNPDTLKKLNEAEKAKKDLEQQEYFDPKLAEEEREKGNESFKQQKYPEAVKHYSESLRRNPKDPKTYSNRAACYTKLGALPEGLKDAEMCIELDPTFSKGYTRKGAVQFFMKEYDKALETYQEGLKHDPRNQELLDGVRRCVEQRNKASRGKELKKRLKLIEPNNNTSKNIGDSRPMKKPRLSAASADAGGGDCTEGGGADSKEVSMTREEIDFIKLLEGELEKFNSFFVEKEEEYIIRLKELQDSVAKAKNSNEEIIIIRKEIVDFHGEMVLLENYSALNYTGLVKKLKKYDKRTGALIRLPFIQRVLRQPFFTTDLLYKLVKECEAMLDRLFPLREPPSSFEAADGDDSCDPSTSSTTTNDSTIIFPKELAEIELMESSYMKSTISALRVLKEIRSKSSTVSVFSLPPLQMSGLEDTWKKVPILEQEAK